MAGRAEKTAQPLHWNEKERERGKKGKKSFIEKSWAQKQNPWNSVKRIPKISICQWYVSICNLLLVIRFGQTLHPSTSSEEQSGFQITNWPKLWQLTLLCKNEDNTVINVS